MPFRPLPFQRLATLARRLQPLEHARSSRLGRELLHTFDKPIWKRPAQLSQAVALRRVQHLAYYITDLGPEPEVLQVIRRIILDGNINSFLDIGANFGFYSWLAREWGVAGPIHLFEPDTSNCQLIRSSLAATNWPGFQLHPYAVSDSTGTAQFQVDRLTGHRGSLLDTKAQPSHHVEGASVQAVPTVSLDELLLPVTDPALVKIDVEGAEEAVLTGAFNFIRRHRPYLVVEAHLGARSPSLTRLRLELGYAWQPLLSDNPQASVFNYAGIPNHAPQRLLEGLQNWLA